MDVSSAADTLMFQGVILIKSRTNFRSYVVVSILYMFQMGQYTKFLLWNVIISSHSHMYSF